MFQIMEITLILIKITMLSAPGTNNYQGHFKLFFNGTIMLLNVTKFHFTNVFLYDGHYNNKANFDSFPKWTWSNVGECRDDKGRLKAEGVHRQRSFHTHRE